MTPQPATAEQRREWIETRAKQWWHWRTQYNKKGDELSDWLNAEKEVDQWIAAQFRPPAARS